MASINPQIVLTVVDGQFGELSVTFDNDPVAITNLKLSVTHAGIVTPGAQGTLSYLPSDADGGYAISGVAGSASITRSFAIKPLDAEAGKQYLATVNATWDGGGTATAPVTIFVEARPEVYAAIGAAERLRQSLLSAYEDFTNTGRTVHKETGLPISGGEPAREALQPTSFQWAMSAVEFGNRIFQSQRGKTSVTP